MKTARVNPWLGELFRLHHRDVVRYAARLVGGRDNAEEVAQNTYLRLAGLGSRGAAIEHPRRYLFVAARNAAIDFTMKRNREWLHRVDVEDIADAAANEDAEAMLLRRQRIVRLAVVLNELPAACQSAFVMNKLEGRTHREIARKLGISVSMVEKHIMRALRHSRDVLREDDGVF